jgi:MFS family permease
MWMLLISVTVGVLMFLVLITIVFPFGRYKFGKDLNEIHYSAVASMNNVARVFFSIYIGKTLQRVGKKNYMLIGFGLLCIS